MSDLTLIAYITNTLSSIEVANETRCPYGHNINPKFGDDFYLIVQMLSLTNKRPKNRCQIIDNVKKIIQDIGKNNSENDWCIHGCNTNPPIDTFNLIFLSILLDQLKGL